MIQNRHFPEIHGNFGFGCMRLPMKGGQVDYDEFSRMAVNAECVIVFQRIIMKSLHEN